MNPVVFIRVNNRGVYLHYVTLDFGIEECHYFHGLF